MTTESKTPVVTWGMHHHQDGLVRFLLIERALFIIFATEPGDPSYSLRETADARDIPGVAVQITAAYEAEGWEVGDYIWTHEVLMDFEGFLHDIRDAPPWALEELNSIIQAAVARGRSLG